MSELSLFDAIGEGKNATQDYLDTPVAGTAAPSSTGQRHPHARSLCTGVFANARSAGTGCHLQSHQHQHLAPTALYSDRTVGAVDCSLLRSGHPRSGQRHL